MDFDQKNEENVQQQYSRYGGGNTTAQLQQQS
jgi:predicted AAA+ superfamily ATPase